MSEMQQQRQPSATPADSPRVQSELTITQGDLSTLGYVAKFLRESGVPLTNPLGLYPTVTGSDNVAAALKAFSESDWPDSLGQLHTPLKEAGYTEYGRGDSGKRQL